MLDYNQIGLKELKQLKRSNKINENKIMKSKNVLITKLFSKFKDGLDITLAVVYESLYRYLDFFNAKRKYRY
ncbi:hypothetical protein DERP_002695 [Dermatophagoides pteronyssinus]|uniref:Uncharacterized protein n=1 Tax=Dermatophagoides pteronyssinus TaxID=6956 RepID=A0ABQ8JWC6_DERPT|nr:hypothetical protein DERP_002695 [Dermatophagoides pteronyssinus]